MKHKTGTGWQSGTYVVTYFLFTPDYHRSLQFKLRRLWL